MSRNSESFLQAARWASMKPSTPLNCPVQRQRRLEYATAKLQCENKNEQFRGAAKRRPTQASRQRNSIALSGECTARCPRHGCEWPTPHGSSRSGLKQLKLHYLDIVVLNIDESRSQFLNAVSIGAQPCKNIQEMLLLYERRFRLWSCDNGSAWAFPRRSDSERQGGIAKEGMRRGESAAAKAQRAIRATIETMDCRD
jgi:hypothetical protein